MLPTCCSHATNCYRGCDTIGVRRVRFYENDDSMKMKITVFLCLKKLKDAQPSCYEWIFRAKLAWKESNRIDLPRIEHVLLIYRM